jgi:hypothetical protein
VTPTRLGHFEGILRPFVERLVLSVSRLDLFLDVEGMQLCGQDDEGGALRYSNWR